MDSTIVNHADPESRVTSQDLKTLPTVSLALPFEDMWGQDGIYIRGEGDPRAVSMEYIDPDTGESDQIDAAVQITGGTSTIRWSRTNKLSMRLKFQRKYGAGKWRARPFGPLASGAFDTIVLDARSNYAWAYHGPLDRDTQQIRAQYLRDQFTADLQRALGGHAPHGRPIHLYMCGLYWGVYVLHERPDEHFAARYLGGESEDYDVVKHDPGDTINGNAQHYMELMAATQQDLSNDASYEKVATLLDIPDFINYMLVNYYGGNSDWGHQNWYATHHSKDPEGRWRFHSWDAEKVLLELEDDITSKSDYGGPTGIHHQLKRNPMYRFAFADLAHKHLTGEGGLTPTSVSRLYQHHLQRIDRAIRAESARWGDSGRRPAYTRGKDWFRERDRLLQTYFPNRTAVFRKQLERAGLYPTLEAPQISPRAERVKKGTQVILSGPGNAEIYYTLDGTDPCFPGEHAADQAKRVLVSKKNERRAMVPTNNIFERAKVKWFHPDFDDRAWKRGLGAAGYENKSGYEHLLGPNFDFKEDLYRKRSSLYLRIPFIVQDARKIRRLTLFAQCDDGFVAYLNGMELTRSNVTGTFPRWNQSASRDGRDSTAINFREFPATVQPGQLREGRNMLAIHAFNDEITSSDMLIDVRLEVGQSSLFSGAVSKSAKVYAGPISINDSTTFKARSREANGWSALAEHTFYTGTEPARAGNLAITAIHYHPAPLTESEEKAGFTKRSQFEFLEVTNIGIRIIDLTKVRFSEGIKFTFADNLTLNPKQSMVIVSNKEAYSRRYGNELPIAGAFKNDSQLSNGGERLTILDALGKSILSFAYDDRSPWPEKADGKGFALMLQAPFSTEPENWRTRIMSH